MATLSPVLVIAALLAIAAHRLGASAWAASGIQGFTVITAIPLAVAYLTVSYFRFIRRAAKPKMKIIGEPSFAMRVKFALKRYRDFMAECAALLARQFVLKPKDQSALRRAAATSAKNAQSDLARQVAEKLATMEAGKLEQIAALLNKEAAEAKKSSATPAARRPQPANSDQIRKIMGAANENITKQSANPATNKR